MAVDRVHLSGSPADSTPRRLPIMRMQWRHLLFMHWPIDPGLLRPLIPREDELAIDTIDGAAWVGLIPFTMRCVQPWLVPPIPGVGDLPAVTAFHECNVRTYVTCKGVPGVWFFSLDAASPLAVWGARKFFHLPYFRAEMSLRRTGDEVGYTTDRRGSPKADMRCRWRIGPQLAPAQPGQLAHFLTERYSLYSVDEKGSVHRGWIRHKPWPLRDAELLALDDSLLSAAGIAIDTSQEPVVHCADRLDVAAWPLEQA